MLHQDNKKRLPPSSPEFIEALTLGNSSCRDIFTTVMGGGDADFFFAGQPRPSPLFVGKRQRPCHLRSPAYKAYALLRFVAEDSLGCQDDRRIESEFLWLGRNFRINQEIHLTSFSLVHTYELLPKNTKVKSTSGRPHWSRRDHKVPKEPWWHKMIDVLTRNYRMWKLCGLKPLFVEWFRVFAILYYSDLDPKPSWIPSEKENWDFPPSVLLKYLWEKNNAKSPKKD